MPSHTVVPVCSTMGAGECIVSHTLSHCSRCPQYQVDPRREADVDKLFRQRPVSQLQRVQDTPLQLLSDDGMCLSMHQPWASLLVAGIKM